MAEFVSVRKQFMEQLKPLLPTTWATFHYNPAMTTVGGPTVVLSQQTVARLPEAPLGVDQTTIVATLITPGVDPDKGEDALEAALLILLDAVDQVPHVKRGDATRATAQNNPAYDLDLTLITPRKEL